MKTAGFLFLLGTFLAFNARADLTMVQKIEGAGPPFNMTIKIKDSKARIDGNSAMATIIDGKTGEMINLMLDQKKIVRISAEKMKAALTMMNKYNGAGKNAEGAKPKLVATGKKEKINGYDTEEYTYETPTYKASYWVAPQYPNSAAILKQLETLNPQLWAANSMNLPDYSIFNGVPIKTVISAGGNQVTSTLVSINQDPIDAAEFVAPKDFEEMKIPDLGNLLQQRPEGHGPP
jgi:hypothetical protein